MRFEFSVALKYLVPRFKQLSVAIISLVSILVVSMVVWLVLVFLSVTDGLEKKWIQELVSINAPVRLSPTDAYYNSYYYQIDSLSSDSNYNTKSLGEKLVSLQTDPYDSSFDSELPPAFPLPDRDESGSIRDLTKEAYAAIVALQNNFKGLRSKEYEVSFGTLQLDLPKKGVRNNEHSYVSQVSYVASHSLKESNLSQMILPPTPEDYQHFLRISLQHQSSRSFLENFFSHVDIEELRAPSAGYTLPYDLYPKEGSLEGIRLSDRVIIPTNKAQSKELSLLFTKENTPFIQGTVTFKKGTPYFTTSEKEELLYLPLTVTSTLPIACTLDTQSLKDLHYIEDLRFAISAPLQSHILTGTIYLDNLQFSKLTSLSRSTTEAPWLCPNGSCTIPSSVDAQGVLIAKQFKKNGIKLGDRGAILYTAPGINSVQEQKLPIFVAGFYDPGLFPMGSKLIFVEPSVTAQLRSNVSVADNMLGNGFNIWLDNNAEAGELKTQLQKELDQRSVAPYWKVDSFNDYEFAKPILTQLKSDKNLFTLIAIIILVVACSNIISMLILLVNDKKREIAIMQAMGLSSSRIGMIFGICGGMIGLLSSIIGVGLSLFTLKHLQSLVDLLSFLQGHDAFQTAFYGASLPNELSLSALLFVLIATTLISLIAALVPAIKASKIRPSQMLRSEG
jgi:lipoprotein-releasing system permease protein